ncbi:hypothetical protein QVD17_05656 [Tagetes erecta]|uniref:Uncharacterized protein n=1 Tax=Tagetes erecta TaxID=13708 RepID=A0AAD8PBB6_TARER|nr:hypothetical protein QVD17_05656 [Tagetes erecta]
MTKRRGRGGGGEWNKRGDVGGLCMSYTSIVEMLTCANSEMMVRLKSNVTINVKVVLTAANCLFYCLAENCNILDQNLLTFDSKSRNGCKRSAAANTL